jgi:hypothetical protein
MVALAEALFCLALTYQALQEYLFLLSLERLRINRASLNLDSKCNTAK